MQSSLTFEPNPFEQSFASKPPTNDDHAVPSADPTGGSTSKSATKEKTGGETAGRKTKKRRLEGSNGPVTDATTQAPTRAASEATNVANSTTNFREAIPGIDKITTPLPLVPGELPGNPIDTPLPLSTGNGRQPTLGDGLAPGTGANGSGQMTPGWSLRGAMTPGILGTTTDLSAFHHLSRNPALASPGVASMLALPLDATRGGVTPGVPLSPSILGIPMQTGMPGMPGIPAGMAGVSGLPSGGSGIHGGIANGGIANGGIANGGIANGIANGGIANGVPSGIAPGHPGMGGAMPGPTGSGNSRVALSENELRQRQRNFEKSPNGLYVLSNTAGDGSTGQAPGTTSNVASNASSGAILDRGRSSLTSQYSSPASLAAQSSHNGSIASSVDSSAAAAAAAKIKNEGYANVTSDDEERKRSRKNSGSTEEGRRKQFLERNRLAAIKCRQRKKQYVDDLKAKTDFYVQAHETLSLENSKLTFQLNQLRQFIASHHDASELPAPVLQIVEQANFSGNIQTGVVQNGLQAGVPQSNLAHGLQTGLTQTGLQAGVAPSIPQAHLGGPDTHLQPHGLAAKPLPGN